MYHTQTKKGGEILEKIYELFLPSAINGYLLGFRLFLKAMVTHPLILFFFAALIIRKVKHTFFG